MSRKLFKQITFQWRSNLWLVIELVIISVVLWYQIDLMVTLCRPTFEPNGFDVDHCYSLTLQRSGDFKPGEPETTSAQENIEIVKRLKRYPGVEAVAVSQGMEPYCGDFSSNYITDLDADSTQYGDNSPALRYGRANADFFRVFRIEGARGESPEQVASMLKPGTFLAAENFTQSVDSGKPQANALDLVGHKFGLGGKKKFRSELQLAGILTNVKREDSTPLKWYSFVVRHLDENSEKDMDWFAGLSVRVRPDADKDFIEQFRKELSQFHVGLSYISDIKSFRTIKKERMSEQNKIMDKMYIVIGFLLLNVFLGLLGTFWYRTRQRVSEMAVRMSFGATRGSIFRRLMSEGVILLVIATVIAVCIDCALAYLELNMRPEGNHLTFEMILIASGITFLLSLLMIFLGVYFPARRAMKIEPALALHDE